MTNKGRFFLGAPNAPLPENGIYAEPSIWLRLYFGDEYSTMVADFLRQAVSKDVPVVTSNLTYLEIRHVLRSQIFSSEAERLGFLRKDGTGDWNRFAKNASEADVKNASALVDAEYQRVKRLIEGFPGVIVPSYEDNGEMQRSVDSLMAKYPLDSNDAKHVAIARSWRINSMASTDADYAVLENTNLYSVPRIILNNGPIAKPELVPWVYEAWEIKSETKDESSGTGSK